MPQAFFANGKGLTSMAQRVQVTCISKRDRQNAHERIRGIGGVNADGGRWWLSEDDAIRDTKNGKWQFYVSVNQRSVDVIVATHNGREYLKTTADGYAPNNLLNLPECP